MNFSSGTLKIIGGVGALSVAAIAIGVGVDQNNKNIQHQRKLAEDKADKETLEDIQKPGAEQKNWFDKGLLGFLEDQDIVFEIFKGDGSIKLTRDNFYLDPASNNYLTIKINALVSDRSEQLKKSEKGKVKVKILKELYKGKDWTWSCHFKLSLISADGVTADKWMLKDEDKFFNNKKDGYFDILAKDLTKEGNEKDKAKWKEIKKGFVKNCAAFFDEKKSPDTLDPKGPNFLLRIKDNAEEDKKLYFIKNNEKHDARKWFGESITLVNAVGKISNGNEEES